MRVRDTEAVAAWYDGKLRGPLARLVERQVRAEPDVDRLTRWLLHTSGDDPPAPESLRQSVMLRYCGPCRTSEV